jgi:hypothetical protein
MQACMLDTRVAYMVFFGCSAVDELQNWARAQKLSIPDSFRTCKTNSWNRTGMKLGVQQKKDVLNKNFGSAHLRVEISRNRTSKHLDLSRGLHKKQRLLCKVNSGSAPPSQPVSLVDAQDGHGHAVENHRRRGTALRRWEAKEKLVRPRLVVVTGESKGCCTGMGEAAEKLDRRCWERRRSLAGGARKSWKVGIEIYVGAFIRGSWLGS